MSLFKKFLIIFFLFALNSPLIYSQNSIKEKKEVKHIDSIYFESSVLFECQIRLPNDYDPEKSYTLVVGLHGYGSSASRFVTLWEAFKKPEFIYAAPEAPYPLLIEEKIGYDWNLSYKKNKKLEYKAAEITVKYIANVVKELKKHYKINDIYLMGFSKGAVFTYLAGIYNHQLFKGFICFGSWFELEWFPENLIKEANSLRAFIAHGKNDKRVKYEESIKARDILIKNGYEVTFIDFDGGHTVDRRVLKLVQRWIKKDGIMRM